MNHKCVLITVCMLPGMAGAMACSSSSAALSEEPSALLNSDDFLYLTCDSTGWSPSDSNRLKLTSNPAVVALDHEVAEPQASNPDRCSLIMTDQLNGTGTKSTSYSISAPSTTVNVPASSSISRSNSTFAIKYPSAGRYTLSVDWGRRTLSVAASDSAVILGDCGVAPKASDPEVRVDYVLVHESNLSRWCVDRDFWESNPDSGQVLSRYFDYGDTVYSRLQTLFGLPRSDRFVYQVLDAPGAAHTGSDFGFGVSVGGDNFSLVVNDPFSGVPIPGFWGYLLTLHEGINDFTGLITPGWPTDWWADNRSPFPNSLDAVIMNDIGTLTKDSNLLAAATLQHERFTDRASTEYDQEVVMFDTLYARYGGYRAFTNAFTLLQQDGIQWTTVDANRNPSALLTEYVIAYLQLGIRTRTDLTQSLFVASGVGSLDPTVQYTVDSNAVRAIATAHCSIRAAAAAGRNVTTQLTALRRGNFGGALASGGTAATCPAECAWNAARSLCSARF